MPGTSFCVEIDVEGALEDCFKQISTIDPTCAFVGFGPLPGVVGVTEQSGDWDAVGQTRKLHLSDRSTVRERITDYRFGEYFGYTVDQFSSPLRFLVDHAEGQWWFESVSANSTRVRWQYCFLSRSIAVQPLVWLIVRTLWGGFMRRSIALCRALVEKGRDAQATRIS